MTKIQKTYLLLFVFFLALIPIWRYLVVPELLKLKMDFSYQAEIISVDDFYDEDKQEFTGDQLSVTSFDYKVTSELPDIIIVKNIFNVKTLAGENIFSVEREYGINKSTSKHVVGYGDKDREGYLFAPRRIEQGDSYIYWHINYDAPATMKFKGQEEILGLPVYHYETNYQADPTQLLGHLPGVPELRGVGNDINLQTWIEPISGRMIKYEDRTLAYYYDINTKERLQPWNMFNNRFSDDTIANQVRIAQNAKQQIILYERWIPILFGLIALALLIALFASRKVTLKSV
jgi:hypothetical protein